jgi:ATP-dependent RNA helicase RhlE
MPEPAGVKPDRVDTRGSQPHRGEHAAKRNRNHGNAKPGHRHEGGAARNGGGGGGGERPAAKPAFKGPQRGGGNQSSGRTGVWSNR